mmetsp:Transcript_28292/g.56986  ORF Transcript_28292/g.56986 Transcript_28292/m.56986 type:complete len:112 (+) Transcript_28292:153-488(+)
MMMTSRVMMFFLSIAFASAFKPGLPNRWVASQRKSRVICMMAGTQRIKFKIYPNGRVEETVYGVKGEQCLKVTEEVNAKLGKVVATQETEEMIQEEVSVTNEVYAENKDSW